MKQQYVNNLRRRRPVKVLGHMPISRDWQEDLIYLLIAAGTDGLAQSKITFKFSLKIDADTVLNELQVLEKQNKVQSFKLGGRGRPKTIWRATTEIMK